MDSVHFMGSHIIYNNGTLKHCVGEIQILKTIVKLISFDDSGDEVCSVYLLEGIVQFNLTDDRIVVKIIRYTIQGRSTSNHFY
jgi:hypothetical protein